MSRILDIEQVGFREVYDTTNTSIDLTEVKDRIPFAYKRIVDSIQDKKIQMIIEDTISKITLFLKTTYFEDSLYLTWLKEGKLSSLHNKTLNANKIYSISITINRNLNNIEKCKTKIETINSSDMDNDKKETKLSKPIKQLDDYLKQYNINLDRFYYELMDFESSLGGVF